VAPPSNEELSDRRVIVIDQGDSLMLSINGASSVAIAGLPRASTDIQCWSGVWTDAGGDDRWRECKSARYVYISTDDKAATFSSNASICTDCADPNDLTGYRPLVLAPKAATGDGGTGEVPRCSEDASCFASQERLDHGFVLGAHFEGQFPLQAGPLDPSAKAADEAAAQLDVGYRFSDLFSAGVYVGGAALPGADAGRLTRGGATIEFSAPFRGAWGVTWLPYGALSLGGATAPYPNSGLTIASAHQVGPEMRAEVGLLLGSRNLSVGPYLAYSNLWVENELYGSQSFGLQVQGSHSVNTIVVGLRVVNIFHFQGDW
jgi:hypothetical protein